MTQVSVAVLSRAPEPGLAKTRLIPTLGKERAARLQAALMVRAVERACAVPDVNVTLWIAGSLNHPDVVRCRDSFAIDVRAQSGVDLGARMQAAVEHGSAVGLPTLVIGTDCPAQTVDDLIAARTALATNDVVVQPATDGGYVLIGMKSSPGLPATAFSGIEWGTERVLAATLAHLRAAQLKVTELRTLPDLDRPEDLATAVAQGWMREIEFA